MPPAVREYLPESATALLEAYFDLAEPLARFFQLELTLRETAYYAFGLLWTLALWAFPGGRDHAAGHRAAGDRISRPDSQPTATFAGRRYLWYLLTPLYPLLGLVLLAIPDRHPRLAAAAVARVSAAFWPGWSGCSSSSPASARCGSSAA